MAQSVDRPAATKSQAQARAKRIKATIAKREAIDGDLFVLVTEAHDQGDWRVLGYESFRSYIETELGLTERSGYRLVNQGRVVAAIEAAISETESSIGITDARQSDPVAVSGRQAGLLKGDLPAAAAEIAGDVAAGEPVETAVQKAVRLRQERAAAEAIVVPHTEVTPDGQFILDERALPSAETPNKGRGGRTQEGTSGSPRTQPGAAPLAETSGEAESTTDAPPDGSNPVGEGEQESSAPLSPNGPADLAAMREGVHHCDGCTCGADGRLVYPAPVTIDDVNRLLARVETVDAGTWRKSVADQPRLLQQGRVFAEAAREPKAPAPRRPDLRVPQSLARREVTPIPKGKAK